MYSYSNVCRCSRVRSNLAIDNGSTWEAPAKIRALLVRLQIYTNENRVVGWNRIEQSRALEILDVNYQVAWRLLKKCYDKKRVITQNHIRVIMELPSMMRENVCESNCGRCVKAHTRPSGIEKAHTHWDDLLTYILSSKLDTDSLQEWQNSLISMELPTFKQFLDFVTYRSQILEATGKSNSSMAKVDTRSSAKMKRQVACAASVKLRCARCKEEHSIYFCPEFLALIVHQRIAEMRKAKLYINCLWSTAYNASKCVSGGCKACRMKHSLLNIDTSSAESQGRDEKSQKAATLRRKIQISPFQR